MAVEYQQPVQNSDYSNPTVLIIGAGISGKDPYVHYSKHRIGTDFNLSLQVSVQQLI
jgi:hypothetical protein